MNVSEIKDNQKCNSSTFKIKNKHQTQRLTEGKNVTEYKRNNKHKMRIHFKTKSQSIDTNTGFSEGTIPLASLINGKKISGRTKKR